MTVRIKCSNIIKNLVLSQLLVTVNCFYLAQQSCRGSSYLKDQPNLKKKKKKIVLKELTHHRKKNASFLQQENASGIYSSMTMYYF